MTKFDQNGPQIPTPTIPSPDQPGRGVDPGQTPTPKVYPHPDSAPNHPTIDPRTGVPGRK